MTHKCDPYFPCSHEKHNQQEMNELKMSAPNAEPARQGGMKSPHQHAPHQKGKPATSTDASQPGIQGHTKGVNPGKNPKNANKLH